MKSHPPLRFLFLIILILVVVSTAIPVINWVRRPADGIFTGLSFESVGDIFVYLNLMDQSAHGAWVFHDMFTSEPHAAGLFNPFLLLLGKLSGVFHLSSLVVWHIARVLLVVPVIFLLWDLLGYLVSDEGRRRWVLVLLVASGPLVLNTPDGSFFLSVLYDGMALLTLCTTILFFRTVIQVLSSGLDARRIALLLILPFLQVFIRPYPLFLWAVVPLAAYALYVFLRRRMLVQSLVHVTTILLPVVAAYGLLSVLLMRNPVFLAWSHNAGSFGWASDAMILFFGLQAPFACAGLWFLRRQIVNNPAILLFLLWLVVGFAIIFSPYPYGYRIAQFIHIPLAAFAALGVLHLFRLTAGQPRKRLVLIFAAVLLFSDNIRHVVVNITGSYYRSSYRYLSADHAAAIGWLRTMTAQESVILHSPVWDTILAQQAYRRVYSTGGWQTVQPVEKIDTTLNVYQGLYDAPTLATLLRQNQISYIYVSDYERISGDWQGISWGKRFYHRAFHFDFHPDHYPFLKEVYSNNTATIYHVDDTEAY